MFEDRVKLETDGFARNQQLVSTVVSMCSCVLQYEALRVQNSDVLRNDSQFAQVSWLAFSTVGTNR